MYLKYELKWDINAVQKKKKFMDKNWQTNVLVEAQGNLITWYKLTFAVWHKRDFKLRNGREKARGARGRHARGEGTPLACLRRATPFFLAFHAPATQVIVNLLKQSLF